jgi:RNA polymerase sigma-32 factor
MAMTTHLDDVEIQRCNLRFIRDSLHRPLLDRERELDLARRWRGVSDAKALHELTLAYTRLVVATAMRFRGYGLPLGDLIQEGNVGLMQAAARFEPSRGVRFSTYAAWWIRAAVQDYILRNWSIVRTGTTAAHKSLFFKLRRLRARLAGPSDAPLSPEQRGRVAAMLRVGTHDVEAMEQRLAAGDRSLSAPIGESGESAAQDLIADARPGPEEVVMGLRDTETRSQWLREALGELSERERRIIAQRRLRDEAVSLEELGAALGVSKERVRQIEQRALEKLKRSILKRIPDHRDLLPEA